MALTLKRRHRFATDEYFDRPPAPAWKGVVIRTDPATYQKPSLHYTWRCPQCRSWTMNGAWLYRVCNFCWTPRPADLPGLPPLP
jgi:hypothetical protein